MRCCYCDTRIEREKPFTYEGRNFCCECMSELCSWYLDGGTIENPKQFEGVGISPDGET